MRSIPQKTGVTVARERERERKERAKFENRNFAGLTEGKRSVEKLPIAQGRMRPQISRKPFEEKLSKLRDELNDLKQFEIEGFDVSKLASEIVEQIQRLEQFLGRY